MVSQDLGGDLLEDLALPLLVLVRVATVVTVVVVVVILEEVGGLTVQKGRDGGERGVGHKLTVSPDLLKHGLRLTAVSSAWSSS